MRDIPEDQRVVSVTGLRKSFGNAQAVRGIDFCVRRGELFSFLGPNGAGKSTTINMLCTLLRPDEGKITVDGIDVVSKPDAVKERIGIVFQESLLDNVLTVKENLRVRASFYLKGRATKEVVERAAEAADVTDFIDRPYGRLSGGQRRRADIARALINTPRVLFMDEPTTGLDPQTRRHVWATIKRLQDEHGVTIFLTTHYMEEAAGSDYAVVVDDGLVAAEGTPTQLKEKYSVELLRIAPKDPDAFAQLVNQMPHETDGKVVKDGRQFTFELARTIDAIPLLERFQPHVESFEVVHGTMDDVFINITGKELRS
ncbi:MAG TPA: ABC transporter ATP-binding protein [Propionicimonas sp.]|nr:ABC transporter ATP-binding protein [Propionicimonas sp.]